MNLEPGMSGTHLDSDGLLGAVGHQDPPYPHSQSGPRGKAERHCSKCGASSAETPRSGIVMWRDSCCVRVPESAQSSRCLAPFCRFRSGPDGPLCNVGVTSMD